MFSFQSYLLGNLPNTLFMPKCLFFPNYPLFLETPSPCSSLLPYPSFSFSHFSIFWLNIFKANFAAQNSFKKINSSIFLLKLIIHLGWNSSNLFPKSGLLPFKIKKTSSMITSLFSQSPISLLLLELFTDSFNFFAYLTENDSYLQNTFVYRSIIKPSRIERILSLYKKKGTAIPNISPPPDSRFLFHTQSYSYKKENKSSLHQFSIPSEFEITEV